MIQEPDRSTLMLWARFRFSAVRALRRAMRKDCGPWQRPLVLGILDGHSRLGIVHELTLPYSPYLNGKQECFWATLEDRLMAMLGGVKPLTLQWLNQATQAWAEIEYHLMTAELIDTLVDHACT